jgi:hypothetical protein
MFSVATDAKTAPAARPESKRSAGAPSRVDVVAHESWLGMTHCGFQSDFPRVQVGSWLSATDGDGVCAAEPGVLSRIGAVD